MAMEATVLNARVEWNSMVEDLKLEGAFHLQVSTYLSLMYAQQKSPLCHNIRLSSACRIKYSYEQMSTHIDKLLKNINIDEIRTCCTSGGFAQGRNLRR